jgi:hypothetical protein
MRQGAAARVPSRPPRQPAAATNQPIETHQGSGYHSYETAPSQILDRVRDAREPGLRGGRLRRGRRLASGRQVNNDPPAIDPGQDAGLTDLTAGSVTAGNARVPWATFSQKNADGSQQIFVRAFKGGAWHTQGFPESLNEDAAQVAQAPSIDFTGANRTVPWVVWAEPSTVLGGHDQIFASRFCPSPLPLRVAASGSTRASRSRLQRRR